MSCSGVSCALWMLDRCGKWAPKWERNFWYWYECVCLSWDMMILAPTAIPSGIPCCRNNAQKHEDKSAGFNPYVYLSLIHWLRCQIWPYFSVTQHNKTIDTEIPHWHYWICHVQNHQSVFVLLRLIMMLWQIRTQRNKISFMQQMPSRRD